MEDFLKEKLIYMEKVILAGNTNLSVTDQKDVKLYEQLFALLKKGADVQLSSRFTANVIIKLQAANNTKSNVLLYTIVSLLFITCMFWIVAILPKESIVALTEMVSKFKWIFVIALILFLVIHFADKKISYA